MLKLYAASLLSNAKNCERNPNSYTIIKNLYILSNEVKLKL